MEMGLTQSEHAPLGALRSLLFVPAINAALIGKAALSSADAVIVDLEDSVVPERKAEAREILRSTLPHRSADVVWFVRINGLTTEFAREDIELVAALALDGLVIPKVDRATIEALPPDLPPLIGFVETARGLADACFVAAHPSVARLQLGAVDLSAELGLRPRPDGLELLHARATLVMASALGNRPPPIDSVWPQYDDLEGLERDAVLGRSLGFGAKACIHPTQVAVVNKTFRPSPREVEDACKIVEAYDGAGGEGVVSVAGAMVDLPVVVQARDVLRRGGK
jgi:citrate lyase beta subunit